MTDVSFVRQIEFQGAFNFRDLGGYQTSDGRMVRWRRLFRSGELHHLTASDLAYVQDVLGIQTVVDLRESTVIEQDRATLLGIPPIQFRTIPIPITPERFYADGNHSRTLADAYLMCLESSDVQQSIVDTLKAIAEASHAPTVFHCSLGKDRTGLIAALLLGVLGVSEADIIADYALSEGQAIKIVERARNNPEVAAWIDRTPTQTFHALPETMEHVLMALNSQYGSVRNFLRACGGDETLFCQLEDALLVHG